MTSRTLALAGLLGIVGFGPIQCSADRSQPDAVVARAANAIYGHRLTKIDGSEQNLSDLKGKVLLIVNVASECGYTKQYGGLQQLHERFASKGLIVMGVPANEFGGQEPGSNADIAKFTSEVYGVDFPMYEKVAAKGPKIHPLFAQLTSESSDVSWNFNKFLIGRDGRLIRKFKSSIGPESDLLVSAIEAALAVSAPAS